MEKPIFGWAASAMTGRDSSARALASRVRFRVFIGCVLLLLFERHFMTCSVMPVEL
ncbi:hypothetical protein KPSA1_03500 [Pseudomonas syringae pv. actinidiae]|uniref:Uncharacterized protein n=1 Tax=Pseudomonas syringae pv. actinidiae TaxID=103796 RepID=A0A2V0QNB4_PSESF|nr:hypothetical protein KPSA1_03500 [Pseudomonas syringae pv. actinidiae]